jgi:hypothetical protein
MKWYEVVPVEECSFLAVDKPQRMRLSGEQVKLNFGSRSPWPAGRILFRQDPATLYLWFVKGQAENRSRVQIPAGYLLAKPYLHHSEAILVYGKKSGEIYTVIHKGRLVAQMVSALATDAGQRVAENVGLLEKEFSMDHPEVIQIPEDAVPTPSWKDLWDFLGMKSDRALLAQALEWAKGAAIAVLAISAFYALFDHGSLQRLVAGKEQQFHQMQQQNGSYRQRMLDIRRESEFWREFVSTEAGPAPWLELMDALAASFKEQNGYLKSVRFSGGELIVQAGLNGTAPELVKQLLATGLFAESKIISTERDPDNPGTDLVNIRLVIQSFQEVTDG